MAVVKKAKKKDVFSVMSPDILGKGEVALIPVTDPKNLVGKRLVFNLIEVLPETNRYYTKISFRITKAEDGKVFTDFDGIEAMRDYVSRMVVRMVKRIDNVQNIVTKDGASLRVKTLATVSRRASSKVEKAVRRTIYQMVGEIVGSSTLPEFLDGIFSDNIKREFIKNLRSVYPLRNFDFRKVDSLKQ